MSGSRLFLALLLSALIAVVAYHRRSLSRSGALAAMGVGTLVLGCGGVIPGLALLLFFLTSTLLSVYRKADKQQLTQDTVEKGGARDGLQVLANGGVAALCCLLAATCSAPVFCLAAVASLAAANADTWATELGLLSPRPPYHVLTFSPVPAGTSGAVTQTGIWGMLAGAALVGLLALFLPLSPRPLAAFLVAAGGVFGSIADTFVGALWQEQRQCMNCGAMTEQRLHRCGGETLVIAGWVGLGNDGVNLLATALGGTFALLGWLLLRG